jgi:alkylation response protein AidB-like acyl-CoA dehydrogenase
MEHGTVAPDDVEAWLEQSWDVDLTLRQWWERLAAAGLAFPTWPTGFGGQGASAAQARAIASALSRAGVVGPPSGVGQSMGGPTVLAHGSPEQIDTLVPALTAGAEAWCQLFSEPSAGSDLAGLRTTAVRDGDRWIVSGQKVWNSDAHVSDRGLLLARTDRSVPKHEGISYFVIDMDQPGVEARPLRQMNGETEFCEVFLTDAVVPAERLIGAPGEGWRVAQTTLGFERAGVSAGRPRGTVSARPGRRGGMLERRVGDLLDAAAQARRPASTGFVIDNRTLGSLATEHGRDQDPIARQELATFRSMTEVNRCNGLRSRAAAAAGQRPGPEASIGKLAMSLIAKRSRDVALDLMGAHGMLSGGDAPGQGAHHRVALASFGAGLGGGTDEIQRNVIGERSLGLPREPQVDRDVPFDQLPTQGTTRPEDTS